MSRKREEMSVQELKAELKRLQDSLCDIQEQHAFTFGKTSVHIGAEKAQNMQQEYDEECREHQEQIRRIEGLLKQREAAREA